MFYNHKLTSLFILGVVSIVLACSDAFREASELVDKLEPEISNDVLTFSDVTKSSVTVNWTKASDNFSVQSDLKYKLYYSTDNNLLTVEEVEQQGTPIGDWVTDVDNISANGLLSAQRYYWNVLVMDEAGHKTLYELGSQITSFAGILDSSFDVDGVAIYDDPAMTSFYNSGQDVLIDNNNKIIIAGRIDTQFDRDLIIWRYSPDGLLDTSFGRDGTGIVTHDGAANFVSDYDEGSAVVLDQKNRILVTGFSVNRDGDIEMATWRYNYDGTIDKSFNQKGFITHKISAGEGSTDYGNDIIVDKNGKILVVGSANGNLVILRYNEDGTLDASFDNDGIVVHENAVVGNRVNRGLSIALDTSGKILVTGISANGTNNDMAVWRFHKNGVLDTSFDSDGIFIYDSGGKDSGNSVIISKDGGILIVGSSGIGRNLVVWKLNDDGTLDLSFDNQGLFVFDSGGIDVGVDIVQNGMGKLYVLGVVNDSVDNDLLIICLNSNGSIDADSCSGGKIRMDNIAGGAESDFGFSIAVDSSDKIIVTGDSFAGNHSTMIVLRFR